LFLYALKLLSGVRDMAPLSCEHFRPQNTNMNVYIRFHK